MDSPVYKRVKLGNSFILFLIGPNFSSALFMFTREEEIFSAHEEGQMWC